MRKQNKLRILPWLLVLVLLVSLPLPVQAAEKYMEGRSADFQIVLDEAGGATITETWDCFFGGGTITRYRRFYTLPDSWEMSMDFQEIRMDGTPMTLLNAPDDRRPEGSAAVFWEGGTAQVEMYLKARNEAHTFEISYYVTNAVQVYNDAAEFHWNLTSEQEAFDIKTLTGTIEIPYGTRDMGLYFWGHGPNENAYFDAIVDDNGMVSQFELYNENIPKDRAVTVRFAMPRELFPDCTRVHDWDGLQEILEEEHGFADLSGSVGETVPYEEDWEEPEEDYEYPDPYEGLSDWEIFLYEAEYWVRVTLELVFGIWKTVALGLAFIPPILLLFFNKSFTKKAQKKYLPAMYQKHRKQPAEAPRYYRSLPDDLKPAMVYKLLSIYPATEEGKETETKGNAFSATVLDLVEEGLLKLEHRADGEMAYLVTPEAAAANLTDYERNVIDLYTTAGADREPKTTQDITTYMREEYSWCKTHYQEFGELVDQSFDALQLSQEIPLNIWNRQQHIRTGVKWGIPVAIGMMWGNGLFKGLLIGAVSGFVNSLVLSRLDQLRHPAFRILTQDGENRYALWKAYGDFLRDFTVFEERQVTDVRVWRKYLVYATALGCSEQVVEQLRIRLPQVYDSLLYDYGSSLDSFRYDDMVGSITTIDTENGYTIRSSGSGSDWSSSDSGDSDWGGFSDSGGDSDSGSSGSDFD